MPNWCMNDITITGPKEKIVALYNLMMEEDKVLNPMVPIGDWEYDKAVNSWGTKWDAEPSELELTEDGDYASIVGMVDTAWGPPIEAFQTYVDNNEDVEVTIRYYEPGMCFIGEFINGYNNHYEYDPEDLSSLDEIPNELLDFFNLTEELEQLEEF